MQLFRWLLNLEPCWMEKQREKTLLTGVLQWLTAVDRPSGLSVDGWCRLYGAVGLQHPRRYLASMKAGLEGRSAPSAHVRRRSARKRAADGLRRQTSHLGWGFPETAVWYKHPPRQLYWSFLASDSIIWRARCNNAITVCLCLLSVTWVDQPNTAEVRNLGSCNIHHKCPNDSSFLMVNFTAKFQMEHGERGRRMRDEQEKSCFF